jgi:hypothetical protein
MVQEFYSIWETQPLDTVCALRSLSTQHATFISPMPTTAQLVQRLAMGWTVREWNPDGGQDFSQPSRLALGPTQPPVQSLPG